VHYIYFWKYRTCVSFILSWQKALQHDIILVKAPTAISSFSIQLWSVIKGNCIANFSCTSQIAALCFECIIYMAPCQSIGNIPPKVLHQFIYPSFMALAYDGVFINWYGRINCIQQKLLMVIYGFCKLYACCSVHHVHVTFDVSVILKEKLSRKKKLSLKLYSP
jgi:hypothetical protein